MNGTGRIDSLDSVRGMAAMSVVIFHVLISFNMFYKAIHFKFDNVIVKWLTMTPLHTLWSGYEAVLLFFVLSGFLLALPFVDERPPRYVEYAIKRFCRIYIPYLFAMLMSCAFMVIFSLYEPNELLSQVYNNRWQEPLDWRVYLSYFFLIGYDITNVNGVVWTLVHELRISLILPLLILFVKRYHWLPVTTLAIVFSGGLWLCSCLLRPFFNGEISSFINYSGGQTCYYVMFFVFGATLAKYRHSIANHIKNSKRTIQYSLFVVALILFNFKWMFPGLEPYKNGVFKTVIIQTFQDAMISLGIVIILVLVFATTTFNQFFSFKPFIWLGKISYSLYLIHLPVIMISGTYLSTILPLKVSLLIVPILSLPIAYLTWRFVEKPSMELGRSIVHKYRQINCHKARARPEQTVSLTKNTH
jgi:peptidoglycan/LPS O-acetylase OafA/YrhL